MSVCVRLYGVVDSLQHFNLKPNKNLCRNLKKKLQKEILQAERKLKEEKEKEEQKQQMIRERKLIEWLNRKKLEKELLRSDSKPDEKSTKTTFFVETKADQTKLNFDAWKMKKLEKEKIERVREEKQLRLNEKLNEMQRSLSLQKHQQWLKTAHEKPRPVPLSQGLLSN